MSTTNNNLVVEEIRLLGPRSHGALRVRLDGLGGVPAREILTGSAPLDSLQGTVLEPGEPGDLVSTFWASVFLVTQRFVDALTDLRATGWRVVPVDVPETPVELNLLCVIGRCGPIDRPSGGFGQVLDPATWDGSDLFVPANEKRILVTGSTAAALAKTGLRNVNLESAGLEPIES